MFKYVKFTKVQVPYSTLEFRGGDDTIVVRHFDGDVVCISGDIEADIDVLIANQASEISCTVITQAEFKSIIELSSQYARIKQVVEEKYTQDVGVLTAQYPLNERETWAIQLEQAKAFKVSGVDTDAPFLKTLADAESDTVTNFADAVILKATEYESFMALKLVDKRAHEKTLMSVVGL